MAHNSNSGDVQQQGGEAVEPRVDEHDAEAEQKDREKLIADARARFDLAMEAESEIRRLALEDLEFRAGNQWPENIKQEREQDSRPCLVINKVPQFIQQVTNDQRQNRPAIKVHPVDDQGDVETAKVMQGLIRHIEYNSNAEVAYDTAFENAVIGGFGYFRIVTDYVSPMSFDQEILIKRIRNPFSVAFDPYSSEPDGSDARFAFITEDLSKEEFRQRYPGTSLSDESSWQEAGNSAPGWMRADSCRVAEYFYKEVENKEIALLSDGQTVLTSDLSQGLPAGVTVVRTRTAPVPVIKWCKLNGVEILEQTTWPGKYIPIIPVYGQELDVNGRRILEGVIRNAKDPARMYNYWASAETEAIALAPRTPFIMAEGQDEGYEQDWETANRRNHSRLIYKPTTIGGQAAPPPQRNAFEPAVSAITQARMLASDDLKATTGIYDAALGAKSNETSGVAIQRRNVQAQTSNFHFTDNLTRSLRHAGRVLLDLMPAIYDTARSVRIIGEDGAQDVKQINKQTEDLGKDGQPLIYRLDAGQYDVTVDVGPSYASKRQEAAASMLELSKVSPQIMGAAADLVVRNMDWPGAQDIADRLKKTLPPNLIDDPKSKRSPLPPQVQAQMQQMGQMIEQMTTKLHEAHDQLDQKRLELESKERIEFKKLEVELEIAMAKMGSQESLALLNTQVSQIEQRLQMIRMGAPIGEEAQEQDNPQAQPGAEPMHDMDPPDQGAQGMNPTGGAAPGLPMEGNSSDQPDAR